MPGREKKKILFVCHIASRSGAPLLLLEIIKEFKKASSIPFQVLVIKEGELIPEFEKLGKTLYWNKIKIIESSSLAARGINIFLKAARFLSHQYVLFRTRSTSTVFLNTITNGEIHKKLLFLKCRFICYVHEMEAAIHIATQKDDLNTTINNTDFFIACSEAVKKNLVINHSVSQEIISLFNSPVSEYYRDKKQYIDFISDFKSIHHIPPDFIVIGVAGTNEWRKGFDLFFPLVTVYSRLFPDNKVFFVWKGLKKHSTSSYFDLYDYKKFQDNKNIILLPHGDNSIEIIACFDIHLLLSREDPYPLVLLEAASLRIPTVCFLNAGGSSEFIENDCGYSTPYCDLIKMAERLNELASDSNLRTNMGLRAQQKVKERHAKETAILPFIDVLEN